MSEQSELNARIEALEQRVKYLEDTFATLADMNKSGEMGQYIAQRQRTLAASKLVNAAAGSQKLNADAQQQIIDQMAAEKAAVDARIEEAIRVSEQNAPAEDDLAEQFTYRDVPGGVEILGFNGFEVGEELVIPNKIKGKSVVGVGKEAFENMTFKKAVLPEGLRYIGDDAFFGCKQLEVINLPDSLERLSFRCLSRTNIKEVKIPSKCKEIPFVCFSNCNQLESVALNDGLEFIGEEAFEESNISSIIIPSSVKKIEMGAFERSSWRNRKEIHIAFLGKDTEIADSYGMKDCTTIYCLPGSMAQSIARLKDIKAKPLSEFKNA